MELYLGLARDVVVKRKIEANRRHRVQGNLFHQEVVLQYSMENFKSDPVVLDIREDIRRLRDELCGRKNREPEWEIVREGTSLEPKQIERKDSSTVELHIPLSAAPKDEGKVEPVVARVHLFLRNEW